MTPLRLAPGGSCTSFRRAGVTFDVGTAMLYGFGESGLKPFRFLINELEEPVEVVAHATLARMTFEGHPITFWPDVERYLQELDRLFPDEKEGLRAFYRDLYVMYENIVLKNELIVPPSEFSARQGLRRLPGAGRLPGGSIRPPRSHPSGIGGGAGRAGGRAEPGRSFPRRTAARPD
jgi:phytoene dehydrogenase-like protein